MILRHTAAREGRLLSFLRREMGLSYGLVKRLKWREAYRVNGVLVHTDHPVKAGDEIAVTIVEAQEEVLAQEGPLSILYEDEAVIALDKPPGLIVHPTFNRAGGTLANRLLGYYQRTGQQSAVHLVSRLDRDTFGVVLAAKNAHIHAILCGDMSSGRMDKTYHAAVYGGPAAQYGVIEHPIARLSSTSLLRCVRADGKRARTAYEVLERARGRALLRLDPQTGRTHQLRVHCAYEGYPILGDAQYGTEASQAFSKAQGIKTHQLCAQALAFYHPLTGERMLVRSNYSVLMISEREG